jgi:hypothetical protein
MDRFEQVVSDSPVSSMILSTSDFTEIELLPVDAPDLGADVTDALLARGMHYLGVIGLTPDGGFRSEFTVPLDPATSQAIAHAFARDIAKQILQPQQTVHKKDVDWLRKLFSLPDTREQMN